MFEKVSFLEMRGWRGLSTPKRISECHPENAVLIRRTIAMRCTDSPCLHSQRPSSRRAWAPFNPAFWTLSSDSLRCSLHERNAGGRGSPSETHQSLSFGAKHWRSCTFVLGETVV